MTVDEAPPGDRELKCPKCKLTNPETARICDCGYDFARGLLAKPPEWSDVASAGKRRPGPQRTTSMIAAGFGCIALAVIGSIAFLVAWVAQWGARPWWLWLWPAMPCLAAVGVALCVAAAKR